MKEVCEDQSPRRHFQAHVIGVTKQRYAPFVVCLAGNKWLAEDPHKG